MNSDVSAIHAYVWMTGSLYAAQWQDVLGILHWLLVVLSMFLAQARRMDTMPLGDAVAQGLGVNLVARMVGRSMARLVPSSAIISALIVLHTDLIGRVVFLPKNLPTGIFVSVIGAPLFAYLLYRMR